MARQIRWTAEHRSKGLGHAYALDRRFYRFQALDTHTWETVEGITLKLWAETRREIDIDDPYAPAPEAMPFFRHNHP